MKSKLTTEGFLHVCDKLGNAIAILMITEHDIDPALIEYARQLQHQCLERSCPRLLKRIEDYNA